MSIKGAQDAGHSQKKTTLRLTLGQYLWYEAVAHYESVLNNLITNLTLSRHSSKWLDFPYKLTTIKDYTMTTITIDEQEYKLDNLSDDAKAQLASIHKLHVLPMQQP